MLGRLLDFGNIFENKFYFILLIFIAQIGASSGVRIGGPTQSYYFGIGGNNSMIQPLIGLDYFGAGINVDYVIHNEINNEDVHEKFEGSLGLFIPRFGVKITSTRNKNLCTYLLVEGFWVIPDIRLKGDFQGVNYSDDTIRDQIEKNLNFTGMTFALGREYFFDEQFSIGGEFGLNILNWDVKIESSNDFESIIWDSDKIGSKLTGSFARAVLNFYF